MAEGFVLNIPKEMLDRLQKADEKIEKLDKNSRRVGENIRLAFMEGAKGVDKFIGSLNAAQKILNGFKDRKINVGLNLDAKAIDDLKKQLSTAGVNIPVGVTGTGSNASGSVPNLQSYLDSIVKITESLANMVNNLPKTTSQRNVSNKGETSIPKTNEELIKSVNFWQTLQREVDKYNQELDKVNKEIKRVEEIRKNIASGKGGIYNPKEHQENINRAKDLQDLINKHQAEQKAIIEKNKALAETFNRQKELKNVGTQQQDIELLRLNEDLTKQEQQALELEKQRTKELKEYEKLLIRIAQLKQEQDKVTKIQNTSTDSNVQAQAQQQQQRIQQLLTQANSRRVELENKLGNDVLQAQHKAGAKELEYLRKKENEKLKEADRALKELMSTTKRWQQQQDRDQIAFYNTRQGALQYSQNAKTINEQIKALNYLRTAQKSLDVSTTQGKKQFYELEREIKRTENALRRYGVQLGGVREQSSHLFNISQQLGRALSLMFSVSQIGQYISKMVNVRKEMELQQRSLQVLLQSKDKANELWNQTLDLAVKSPFRVKELVTYTKQLAAYRIESDKLFETNKMLADVSAGLGVDMQRLILAFGQVKSASFLRGTELRQFTEAGIPMLEELSKYFEELYGRSVSVAEVFDMISKRMVTFADVETVFQRMTSAGGVFFNMQEELSQTTAGMISNLQDSIDLMFNEIGKKNQGIINTAIKWARGLVNNWETVGMVMKSFLVIFASYKALTIDWGKALDGVLLKINNIGTNITSNLKGNLIAGSIMIVIGALLAAWRAIAKYRAGINEAIDAHAKFADSVNELSIDFNRLEIDKKSEDIEEYKDKLSQLVGIAQQQYSIEIDFVVNDLQSIDEVKRKFNELKEQIMSFNNFSLAFDIEFAEQERIARGDNLGRGISKDIETLSKSQKDLVPYFTEVNKILAPMIENYSNLTEEQKKFVDAFKSQGETESAANFFNRQKEGLAFLAKEYDKFFKQYTSKDSDAKWYENAPAYAIRKIKDVYNVDYGDLSKDLQDYYVALDKVAHEQENLFANIEGNLETRIAEAKKDLGDSWDDEKSKKMAEDFILNAINAKATAEEWTEEIRYEFYKKANEVFGKKYKGFNIIPTLKTPDPIKLKQWQQKFNEEVEKASMSISGKMKTEEYDYDLFRVFDINEDEQGLATTETKKLAELNQALDEAVKRREEILGKQRNNSPLFSQDELDDINLYIEKLTNLRDLLGGDDDKEKTKKKNKTLKESINDDISILKSAYDKFQELNENFSSAESFEKVKQAYGKAVGEISGLTIKQSASIDNATEIITESIENYDNALVGFTKAHESFRAEAYDLGDSAITIGYGSTNKMFPDEGIVMGATITEEKAEELLRKTLDNRNDNLKKVIEEKSQELGIEINQSMYNALIDMGYQGAGTESFYTNFFDRVLNVDKGAAYISNIAEKIGGVFGEDFEHPFTESFIEAFKVSDIEHRIAMMLEASNLTVNGGEISKALFKGMLKRSQDRRDLAMGSLEYDFTTLEGLKKALESLIPKAASAGEQAMNALLKAISDVDVEIGVRARVKENEKIAKEISDMFSGYEIGLELKDLNMPSNIVKDVFGEYFDNLDIDVSLDEILNKIQQFKTELDNSDIDISSQLNAENVTEESKKILQSELEGNRKRREQLTKDEQKVTEMLNKEYLERLKTYTKYLLNEQHERVKIRLETLRKLQEVEATSEFTNAQKETITNKLKEEEKESLAKQTWKDFETSPMYMQLFDDIENMSKGALEQMIVTMGGLKNELQSMGLPASDLKEILSQIDKVEEELERRNPFRNFTENANIALNRSKELARLEEQRAAQQKDYDYAKASYDNIQTSLVENEKILETLDKESSEYQVQKSLVDMILKSTNYWANEVDKAESNLAETNNQINEINDSSNDFYEQLKNIGSITKSVVDGVFQITDAMSWLPEETQLSLERMKGLSDSAFTIAGGIGSIMSGDIIGGITSLISGVSGLVSLFMEWSSGAKEAAIQTEKQGRLLTDLQNKYDRLNKAIDEAWNVAQIKQYNAELQKNLQQQIVAQKAIIEAQKSVKGANDYGSEQWSAVKEAEEELQNLYDTQEELQKNIYSKLTGGIMDDVLSTTESFVDAWYDAFKETGDGLKGLEDSFNEMLLNLVKRQASMKIAGRFIDEWDKALERYASEGGLSDSEIEYYANKVKNDLPALSSQLETFFSSFDNVLGDASGNLSVLQRGLTQLSESTGQELASYLNSIRYIVMDSNVQLKTLVAQSVENNNGTENPMISQLKVIAQQTSAINTLLSSLVKSGHGLGGVGLKVFI